MNPIILLVNNDEAIYDQLKVALSADYQVLAVRDCSTALAQVRQVVSDLILLDLGVRPDVEDGSEGLTILRKALRINPFAKVIVITDNSDQTTAIEAIKSGAYDFIEKPVQLDVLKAVLQRARYLADLERDNRALTQPAGQIEFEGMVGGSEPMQEVFQMIRRVGQSDVPVLISGESGTGKELVARAIHRQSRRKDAAFVVINCGAIPETLLESELFGYEKGAFTGAVQQRKGRIEHARGGTLFLDEIGDIPLSLQVKLLRFLQDHEIQRLGGKDTLQVDVRILAATNVNLQKAIAEGRFREDLYYRLCVVTIALPVLNKRGSDILLLAKTFLARFAEEQQKPVMGITPQAVDALMAHTWPGNVRELENRIRRAVVMVEGKYVTPENLGLKVPSPAEEEILSLRISREQREKEQIRLAMEKVEGNVSRAAANLGVSRPTLYQLLRRYGLKKSRTGSQAGNN